MIRWGCALTDPRPGSSSASKVAMTSIPPTLRMPPPPLFLWYLLSVQYEPLDHVPQSLLVVGACDDIRRRPDRLRRVAHGHPQSRRAEHLQVVEIVADGDDLRKWDFQLSGDELEGHPLAAPHGEDLQVGLLAEHGVDRHRDRPDARNGVLEVRPRADDEDLHGVAGEERHQVAHLLHVDAVLA